MIYLASYKGTRKQGNTSLKAFYNSLQDTIIRFLTNGKYTHCELAIKRSDGKYDCYSSSIRDGGVRHKIMSLPSDRWDLQRVDGVSERDIVAYYNATKHHSYDTKGALGVVLYANQDKAKSFCSEWCYNLIFRSTNGWRFSPSDLDIIVSEKNNR